MDENTVNTPTLGTTGILTNIGGFLAQVYGWMALGLLITAAVAFPFAYYKGLQIWMIRNVSLIYIAFFVQLILVIVLSAAIERLNTLVASLLFVVYSALMGLTLSGIFMAYELGSVFTAFVATTVTFITLSAIGYFTKRDLTGLGGLAIMGLIGVIIGTIVNLFLRSAGFDIFLTYIGIFVFMILIAYDTQKIKNFAALAENTHQPMKYAIIAALNLYLDFINLFLRLLSLFGKRR